MSPWIIAYLAATFSVCVLWIYFNFSKTYRSNLKYHLNPNEVGNWLRKKGLISATQPEETAGVREFAATKADLLPSVAVLSPGRNEGNHINTTLPSLCVQNYPGSYRVLFIDDDSEDNTQTVCAKLIKQHDNLNVLRNEGELPTGWVGKCWALHQGYKQLQKLEAENTNQGLIAAKLLCFTDADIHWEPSCLLAAVEYMKQHDADVVALFPKLKFGTVSEALVQLQLMLALGVFYPFEKAMDPKHPETLTTGAFILVKREAYDRIGGHHAVKGDVLDDIKLGISLKENGANIRIAMGGGLLWCRMYDGWWDMWEGLTKSAFAGLHYSLCRAAGMCALTILGNILVPAYLAISLLVLANNSGAWWAWLAVGFTAGGLIFQTRMMNAIRKMVSLNWWYAFAMPIGCAIYLVILTASIWHNFFGGNIWKGRRYTKPARA